MVTTVDPSPCVFCAIVAGDAPAEVLHETKHTLIFTPLNPVTEGHVLAVPKMHVTDFKDNPWATTETVWAASEYAQRPDYENANLITSAGSAATQTVFHLHWHIVPRRAEDGLLLPWNGDEARAAAWSRGLVYGYYQERGYSHEIATKRSTKVPPHLTGDVPCWNPYDEHDPTDGFHICVEEAS